MGQVMIKSLVNQYAVELLQQFGLTIEFAPPGPLADGDWVSRLRSDNPQHYGLANQLGPMVQVSFGSPPITVNEVAQIQNRVVDVLERFVWDFPSPAVVPN